MKKSETMPLVPLVGWSQTVAAAGPVYSFQSSATPAAVLAIVSGCDTTAPPKSADAGLTHRELEVLRLVAAGRSTREIADQLNRSVKTIETHKQSLKLKLDAESPAMLVRKAIAFLGEGH